MINTIIVLTFLCSIVTIYGIILLLKDTKIENACIVTTDLGEQIINLKKHLNSIHEGLSTSKIGGCITISKNDFRLVNINIREKIENVIHITIKKNNKCILHTKENNINFNLPLGVNTLEIITLVNLLIRYAKQISI